jgi:hypothetical protein
MLMNRSKSLIAAALAVMFLGACGSGGLGGVLGGGDTNARQELRGTVESVDAGSRSIWLRNVTGYNGSMLSSGGNSVRVYYDDQTSVEWQGRSYRPQDMERGDEVTVRVDEQGSTLVADAVTVTHNVSSGTSPGSSIPGSNNYATIRGTVRAIDTYNRTIELESTTWRSGFTTGGSTSANRIVVNYDPNMNVDVNGQLNAVSGLERGDVVDVQVRTNDNNASTYWAQRIWLVRNVRN